MCQVTRCLFTWSFPLFPTKTSRFFHYFFMAYGKHGFCQEHLLYLKFRNTFYLAISPSAHTEPVTGAVTTRRLQLGWRRGTKARGSPAGAVTLSVQQVPVLALGARGQGPPRGHSSGSRGQPGVPQPCPGPGDSRSARAGEKPGHGGTSIAPGSGLWLLSCHSFIFRSRIPFVPRLAEPRWCRGALLEQPA